MKVPQAKKVLVACVNHAGMYSANISKTVWILLIGASILIISNKIVPATYFLNISTKLDK